jgi:uracil permease
MEHITGVKKIILGLQMLFVAFGALVLVPLLTGLDPSIALFTAGAGTLLFQAITKGKVPVFLASSFAFIAPIQYGMKNFGVGETLGGLACAGLTYLIFSFLVKQGGVKAIERYLPPIVTGPVIMVIGLNLAPVAVGMTKHFGSGETDTTAVIIAAVTLLTAILVVSYGKKLFSLIPILTGIVVGYILSLILGKVSFEPIYQASWVSLPWVEAMRSGSYAFPVFDINAIIYILPVAIAPAIEHVGDILAISSATGKDYLKEPGLHRTLLGDGLATTMASLLGGPPNTTYSEVTGAVALTKAFDPAYMRIAAVFAICLAFFGKLGAVLKTIPVPVMGGIMFLLFGMIAAIGISTLVKNHVDMGKPRNLVIASVVLVCGIGGVNISLWGMTLGGIGLAGIVGILLNLILPSEDR